MFITLRRFRSLAARLPIRPGRAPTEREWIDGPEADGLDLYGNLADLRRINRWLGGIALTLRGLQRTVASYTGASARVVLDVASGDGWMARELVRCGARKGMALQAIALDRNDRGLRMGAGAREGSGFLVADGRCLPFADASVDIATCSLVLHHLTAEDAVSMLAEMGRVSRYAVIINDLTRTWHGLAGAWLLTRLLTRNPMTRHDAPLSVRRAYTEAEMAALAAAAGLEPVRREGFLGYRVVLTMRKKC